MKQGCILTPKASFLELFGEGVLGLAGQARWALSASSSESC